MTWRLVDHTADVAIECDGPTRGAVLADAATALACVVTGAPDPRTWRADAVVEVSVEAPDEGALAVAWLSEVLWLLEEKGLLWVTGGVDAGGADAGGWKAVASGNAVHYDPAVHGRGVEVKAITYHDLALARNRKPGAHGRKAWHLRVVLDI